MKNFKEDLCKTKIFYNITENIPNKFLRVIVELISFPILIICAIYENGKIKRIEKSNKFENGLAVAAIVKNETPYIKEWIEYHRLVGVDKFYIYDNESEDNLKDYLKEYIDKGIVEYRYFPGKKMQIICYHHALVNYRFKNRYMGFIDIDEFLVPTDKNKSVYEVACNHFATYKNAAAYGINWRHFGSSFHDKKPQGLVTENYMRRAEDNFDRNYLVKTIVNPRHVVHFINPHHPIPESGYKVLNENGTELTNQFSYDNTYNQMSVFHYFCKSKEEARAKMIRGKISDGKHLDWSTFEERDRNEVVDKSMGYYLSRLKEIL